jgi:DUF917 family protein
VIAVPADEPGLRALVYGGAVLGGGGGGSLAAGLESAGQALAVGAPRIVPLAQLPDDAVLATLSAVGSASGTSAALPDGHFTRALSLFQPFAGTGVSGFIASEVGPRAVTYGLLESARTGIPVVDAPANGRAHPLFAMGSLGLHRQPRRLAATVAVGGRTGAADYLELAIRANVTQSARIVRDQAARSRIALAVVRNAAPAAFIRERAAVGGLAFAHEVGRVLLTRLAGGPCAVLPALARLLRGRVLARGRVSSVALSERGGFTVGRITVEASDGRVLATPVCNEFMAVLHGAERIAAFPDLIALFDGETGLPLASTEVRSGRPVAIFFAPRDALRLGAGMRDPGLLRQVERLIGVRLAEPGAP